MMIVYVRLEGRMVEDGVRVTKQELLDDPPRGRRKGNVAIRSSEHARVKEGKPITFAIKDQRA